MRRGGLESRSSVAWDWAAGIAMDSHLIGIMISKTIGFRGTLYRYDGYLVGGLKHLDYVQ